MFNGTIAPMAKCKVCAAQFEAYRPLQVVCSVPCAKAWAKVKAEKEEKQKISQLVLFVFMFVDNFCSYMLYLNF